MTPYTKTSFSNGITAKNLAYSSLDSQSAWRTMLARLQLDFRPNLTQVGNLHRFVCDLLGGLLDLEDDPDRIGLTVFELVENVIKYSIDGRGYLDLSVRADGDHGHVEVRVHSVASSDRVAELIGIIHALRSEENLMALYLRWMIESSRRNEGSGLGLARICAEANMDLDLVLDGDLPTDQAPTLRGLEVRRQEGHRLVTLLARTTVPLRRSPDTDERVS